MSCSNCVYRADDYCDYYGEYIDGYDTCFEFEEVNHE